MAENIMLKKRFERFRTILSENGYDAALITSKTHFLYLLGFKTESESRLLIPNSHSNEEPLIFTSALEEEIIKASLPFSGFKLHVGSKSIPKKTLRSLEKKEYKQLLHEKDSLLIPNTIIESLLLDSTKEQVKNFLTPDSTDLELPGVNLEKALDMGLKKNKVMIQDWDNHAVVVPRVEDFAAIAEYCLEYAFKALGIEYDMLTHQGYLDLTKNLRHQGISNFNVKNIGIELEKMRILKELDEIEALRKAAAIGDIGFKAAEKAIHELLTEDEVQAEAEYAMKKAGGEQPSFETIVEIGRAHV